MEPLHNKHFSTAKLFVLTGLLLLSVGMIFGLGAAAQYILPNFLKQQLSFEKMRPLHVSAVVFWIIVAAMGSVFTYLQQYNGKKLRFPLLAKVQFMIFLITIIFILISYCFGEFGGREYWEFHPFLAMPIAVGWILFLINFIASLGTLKKQPVYVWMWLTGIVFFLFTFLESYLWLLPYFRNNIINDMTVQWKSYGSMVGTWNMLIYGSSIFLMEKISGNKEAGRSPMAFVLYFTGFTNLLFNWGHHIYTLPTHQYIQYVSYAISMTELFIFGRIIYTWRTTISNAQRHFHIMSFRMLAAADFWVFLNLVQAIVMSIPAINVYTHGTHFTVAHTMGTTIGINTFLLLSFAFDMLHDSDVQMKPSAFVLIRFGFWITNISLLVFWLSLIFAGIAKAHWQMSAERTAFNTMMEQLRPYFDTVLNAGIVMIVGFLLMLYPLVKNLFKAYLRTED